MNIVYAIKIFAAFIILATLTRAVVGRGLRLVMEPNDWRLGWWGLAAASAVACFSIKPGLYFVTLPICALFLAQALNANGHGRLLAYALLLTVCPPFFMELDHIGPIQDLMNINPFRILSIVLLAPEAIRLVSRRDKPRKPSWLLFVDVAVIGYATYWAVKLYGQGAFSVLARQILGVILDTLLPYYVISRACVAGDARRRMLSMFLLGSCYQAVIAVTETLMGKTLYVQLQWMYGANWGMGVLMRGERLRASGAFPGPLALAVLLLFALGVWATLRPRVKSKPYSIVGLVLVAGLLSTFGRGPWMAGIVLALGIGALGVWSGKRFLAVTSILVVAFSIFWSYGGGDSVVSLIQQVSGQGDTGDFNVKYRQELLDTSIALLKQSPWWGVPNFLQYMQDLRQGEGIIDLVNTYLVVSLNAGLVGLFIFLIPFAIIIWLTARKHTPASIALGREGPVWLALCIAMLCVIFTVSPISIVAPLLIWTIALGAARLWEEEPPRTRRPGQF
jgi:hypothetical protein